MGRRVSLAMSQDVRGRTRHDGNTQENVGPERQVDSGTDWPVRPQMQLVAPISIAEVTVLCRFLRANVKLSPSCVERMQEVDGDVFVCFTHTRCSSGKLDTRHVARLID